MTTTLEPDEIIFWYRNHRGEESYRHVRPISLRFGCTEWHPEHQWLLRGFDLEKKAEREFALRDARHLVGSRAIPFGPGELDVITQDKRGTP